MAGRREVTTVPRPGLLTTSREPEICSMRSLIPRIPKWPSAASKADVASKPHPSSRISRWIPSGPNTSRTETSVGAPCCTALRIASRVTSNNVMDVTINKRFDLWGGSSSLYFNVQNIGNTRAPLVGANPSVPGLFYPSPTQYSDMGRYFTIGIKGNF